MEDAYFGFWAPSLQKGMRKHTASAEAKILIRSYGLLRLTNIPKRNVLVLCTYFESDDVITISCAFELLVSQLYEIVTWARNWEIRGKIFAIKLPAPLPPKKISGFLKYQPKGVVNISSYVNSFAGNARSLAVYELYSGWR